MDAVVHPSTDCIVIFFYHTVITECHFQTFEYKLFVQRSVIPVVRSYEIRHRYDTTQFNPNLGEDKL